jgi:hypothetical protein
MVCYGTHIVFVVVMAVISDGCNMCYGGGVVCGGSVVCGSSIMDGGVVTLVVSHDALGGDSVTVSVETSVGRGQEGTESYNLKNKKIFYLG